MKQIVRYVWMMFWLLVAAPALALKPVPPVKAALVFDASARMDDGAFNQSAIDGANRAAKELGITVLTQQVPADKAGDVFLRELAANGVNVIIGIGYQHVVPVLKVAESLPHVKFTVIDGTVPPMANTRSVEFKNQEGAFLVGVLGAMASKTGKLGFIGGVDIPVIRNFAQGYIQGAHYAKPETVVKQENIGTTLEAWNNPGAAEKLALAMMDDGVDVIFAAAGASSIGALKAAQARGVLAIGVDANQNGVFPGSVLTSMVKRVDAAVFDTLRDAKRGVWRAGQVRVGVKENAVGYVVDAHNRTLLTPKALAKAEEARAHIINGTIALPDATPPIPPTAIPVRLP